MIKAYIAEVIVNQKCKLVPMFLQKADLKAAQKELTSRYQWAGQVELKALIPDIAPVRPTVRPIVFA